MNEHEVTDGVCEKMNVPRPGGFLLSTPHLSLNETEESGRVLNVRCELSRS